MRRIKAPSQPVSDLELALEFGDSSDDSDFNVENHKEPSDDDSFNSDEDNEQSESDDSELEEGEIVDVPDGNINKSVSQLIEQAKSQGSKSDLRTTPICSVCLGARSDHDNEIVECDRCGVSVHECCYGVNDSASVSSTDSLTPTEPWFCEPCKEGVMEPFCELCPNTGGIFKATDVGRWVHLVCALYVPAIAFGEVERLANVTLFEMPYNKWGSKPCGLCPDERLSRCGVTIACDAGMCKQFFHVTCGQKEGLLSEAWSEDVDQADPFYAHCKLHTDKQVMHRRRTNFIILSVRQHQRRQELEAQLLSPDVAAQRVLRKLKKKQMKYRIMRQNAVPPWVPTQKMPRPLLSSATACRALWLKADLMDVDVLACESKETRDAILREIANKWHISPAMSVEFIAYFLDRNSRIPVLKSKLQSLLERNAMLSNEHEALEQKYNNVVASKEECEKLNKDLRDVIETYHKVVKTVEPGKRLPIVQDLMLQRATHGSPMMVPTAAALKAGVGYPLLRTNYKGQVQTEPRRSSKPQTPQPMASEQPVVVSCNECGICHGIKDQHLMTRCDACQLFYHLGCLSPPLTRMPKKTKLQGWECSECDKETSPIEEPVTGRRRPRHKSPPCLPDAFYPKDKEESGSGKRKHHKTPGKKKKKRKIFEAAQHENEEPTIVTEMPHIKIKIKAIPSLDGLTSGTFLASSIEDSNSNSPTKLVAQAQLSPIRAMTPKLPPSPRSVTPKLPVAPKPIKHLKSDFLMRGVPDLAVSAPALPLPLDRGPKMTNRRPEDTSEPKKCDTCHGDGDGRTLVRCDECRRCYHFGCLDPPLKKTPKVRGYSWHCADCDPSDGEKK